MNNVTRFSATDRDAIRKHVIGKPTGVIATIGGIDFDLVPITTEQSKTIFEIIDAVVPLWQSQDAAGEVVAAKADWATVVATEGKRTLKVLRDVLHESAVASDLIDESDAGEEVFDEWFAHLAPVDALRTLYPKFLEAQGLKTLLGNASTPPDAETPAAGTTSP